MNEGKWRRGWVEKGERSGMLSSNFILNILLSCMS
jgi:uncharacterized membrane protein YqaE (UPF0057 family)